MGSSVLIAVKITDKSEQVSVISRGVLNLWTGSRPSRSFRRKPESRPFDFDHKTNLDGRQEFIVSVEGPA